MDRCRESTHSFIQNLIAKIRRQPFFSGRPFLSRSRSVLSSPHILLLLTYMRQAIPGCEEYASASLTSWFNNRRTRERKAAKAQSSPAPNQPLLPDALAKLKILYDSSNSITPQLLDTWASLLQVDSLAIAAAISLFQTPASTSGTMYEPPTPQATTSPEPMPLPLYLKTESDRLESPILLEHPMSRIPEATLWTGEPSTSNPLHHNPTFPTTFQPPPLTHNQVEQVIREAGRDAQKSLAGVPPKTLEQFNERFLEYEDTLTGFLGQIKNGELREWGFDPG